MVEFHCKVGLLSPKTSEVRSSEVGVRPKKFAGRPKSKKLNSWPELYTPTVIPVPKSEGLSARHGRGIVDSGATETLLPRVDASSR